MKFTLSNRTEICYNSRGSGDPLVLIGGFGMTMAFWDLQVQALKKHFRVIVFDNRGAGKSTIPSEPFTLADMALDVIALMDELRIESAHIFGVSMGGMIAQLLCLDHKSRVKKAALGCTSPGGRHAVHAAPDVGAALAQAANPDLTPEQAARLLVPFLFSQQFVQEQPERVEAFIALSVENAMSVEGAAAQMGALGAFDTGHRLGEIQMPVLVVTGNEDRMIPPENGRLLSKKIPGATLKIMDGAGHNVFFEQYHQLNRILMDFFRKK